MAEDKAPDSDSSPSLRGEKLTCIRGDRVVFAGLDFCLSAGEALVLIGPNGAGKSSLLRIMAGLVKPWAGRLFWNGLPMADQEHAHRAGLHYVGHSDALKPALTVRENLAFWCGQRRPAAEVSAAIADALDRVSLTRLHDYPARLLSAGQKRRLNLARLFAAPVPLWILDEPANGLDRDSVAMLRDAVASHRAGGGMLALAAHGELAAADALPDARQLDMGPWSRKAAALAEAGVDALFGAI